MASLPADALVISGGARGVGRCAIDAAKARRLRYREFLASWDLHGRYWAGRIRNQLVAEHCERMVAFWDGRSSGTRDAFQRAQKLGRPVVLYRLRQVVLVGRLSRAAAGDAASCCVLKVEVQTTLSDGRPITMSYEVAATYWPDLDVDFTAARLNPVQRLHRLGQ